ncbi:MAG: hypothetical protein Q8P67_18470 [archaeon]|nr:hypothetical protein [archaeon]
MQLYDLANSRTSDKGDVVNLSLIRTRPPSSSCSSGRPSSSAVLGALLLADAAHRVHVMRPSPMFNIVIDGGATCSRRLDRQGMSLSDVLPVIRPVIRPLVHPLVHPLVPQPPPTQPVSRPMASAHSLR